MKTNVLLVLDVRRPKPDGTYQLVIRIIHNQTVAEIRLGKYFKIEDWDSKERKIKATYKGTESVVRLNNYIQKKKSEVVDFITALDEKKKLGTISHAREIRDMIVRSPEKESFFGYMQEMIDTMKSIGKIGNARSYHLVMSAVKTHVKHKDLSFLDVNYDFLVKLEQAHLKKGGSVNGLAVYMRTIKAVYNNAIKAGVVERDLYPFANFKIKTKKTRKRAISVSEIRKVEELVFEPAHPLYHTHNYFLFCFDMMGLPFADMAYLKLSNLIGGRLVYNRQKTEKGYNIKITASAQKILDKYISGKSKEDYIFPIIKRKTLPEQYKDVEWARSRYNKKLKQIGQLCGIEENLTSYVGRHTFASLAKNLGVPVANISDMLGHSSTRTTEIYLDTLPADILDQQHEEILKSTKNKKTKKG